MRRIEVSPVGIALSMMILFLISTLTVFAEDTLPLLTTTDGKVYKSVTITKVDPDGIHFSFESGAGFVPFEKLSSVIQEKYGYDPEKSKAFRDAGKERELTRQAAMFVKDGELDLNAGEFTEAISCFTEAIQLNPKSEEAYEFRGESYARKNDYDLAIIDLNQAILLHPTVNAYICRGYSYDNKGEEDLALMDSNQAILLDPKKAEAYIARGVYSGKKGKFDLAMPDFNRAILLDPDASEAFRNRSQLYALTGNYKLANDDLKQAIHVGPQDAWANDSFAWLLSTCPQADFRNGNKAVEYAITACKLSEWKETSMFATLAAAYAELGDFDSAVNWENKYLETPTLDEKGKARSLKRLSLYQDHKPFHEDIANQTETP